jgi:hypothetical protein
LLLRLLLLAALVGFVHAPRLSTIPPSNPNPAYNLYLPLAINVYPLVDIVVDGVVDYIGYPGTICMFGHVIGDTPTTVYSVTLAIDVTVYPYCGPELYEDCLPYSETHYAKPELEATLPDQINPFSYCLMYTKGYYSYSAVELASASLNPPNGRVSYPLTVTSLTKDGSEWDTIVYGTVKNN